MQHICAWSGAHGGHAPFLFNLVVAAAPLQYLMEWRTSGPEATQTLTFCGISAGDLRRRRARETGCMVRNRCYRRWRHLY